MHGLSRVVAVCLLAAGVGVEIFCCLGVLVMRGALARLHYTAPAGLGAVMIAVAVLVREGFSLIGDKALLIAIFLLISAPVLSHVTARAAQIRARGDVSPRKGREEAG